MWFYGFAQFVFYTFLSFFSLPSSALPISSRQSNSLCNLSLNLLPQRSVPWKRYIRIAGETVIEFGILIAFQSVSGCSKKFGKQFQQVLGFHYKGFCVLQITRFTVFVIQIVIQSSKVIPVLVLGVIAGRTYTVLDFASATLQVVGIGVLSHIDSKMYADFSMFGMSFASVLERISLTERKV
jgi:hypothetical protein